MNDFVTKNATSIAIALCGAVVSLATFAFNAGGKSTKLDLLATDMKEVKQDVKDISKQVNELSAVSRKENSVATK